MSRLKKTRQPTLPDADWRRRFRRRLRGWFGRAARDLPWRRSTNVYRVWVSEIMLQQTQVATVEPYFVRFMKAFPTIAALAAADEQEVLKLWEGLGYYRRARQLHRAARRIVAEHGGRFPRDPVEVQQLPGIGRYTAGAILSIAFDARTPIVEANTRRMLARLLAYRGDLDAAAGLEVIWNFAETLLPRKQVGEFNQALMELGSLVCLPKSPRCEECPVRALCPTAAAGWQSRIPRPQPKKRYEVVREAAVVVRRNGRVLLRQRGEGERWAGLWDFPRFEMENGKNPVPETELARKVRKQTGIAIKPASHLTTIKHGVTRFRITLECYLAEAGGRGSNGAARRNGATKQKWIRISQLADLPLNTTGRKIAGLLTQKV